MKRGGLICWSLWRAHHSLLETPDTQPHTARFAQEIEGRERENKKEPHNVTWRVRPFGGSRWPLVVVGILSPLYCSLYRVIMRPSAVALCTGFEA